MYFFKPVWCRKKSAFCIAILNIILFCSCNRSGTSPLTAEQAVAATQGVRDFAAAVADDVSHRGPAAWRDHFADTPSFFMASDGQLVFANSDAATQGIKDLTGSITHIELKWGDPINVDPLTTTLAMMAAPYHENIIDSGGHKIESNGYFTGLAELGTGGWKFRDAHWSSFPNKPVTSSP